MCPVRGEALLLGKLLAPRIVIQPERPQQANSGDMPSDNKEQRHALVDVTLVLGISRLTKNALQADRRNARLGDLGVFVGLHTAHSDCTNALSVFDNGYATFEHAFQVGSAQK